MREIQVGKNDSGIRLDKFLARTFPTMPKSLMYKYIRLKCIKINGKKSNAENILTVGDTLTFFISDEFFGQRKEEAFQSLKPNLNIVFEDENILIVNKPAGLVVHSDANEEYNTLINRVKAYLFQKGDYQPESENSFAPSLCNRIDRNTEGLVIAAKNAQSLREMNSIIKNREVQKKYLCVVHGIPKKTSDTLKDYLIKIADENKVVLSKTKTNEAKTAILNYNVLNTDEQKQLSLLEVELITGRTHQIRAQLAAAGYPLLGDGKYSGNSADRKQGFNSQALCAHSLSFTLREEYPLLGYLNNRCFESPKPSFLRLFNS